MSDFKETLKTFEEASLALNEATFNLSAAKNKLIETCIKENRQECITLNLNTIKSYLRNID